MIVIESDNWPATSASLARAATASHSPPEIHAGCGRHRARRRPFTLRYRVSIGGRPTWRCLTLRGLPRRGRDAAMADRLAHLQEPLAC